jgi:hypothetical protein
MYRTAVAKHTDATPIDLGRHTAKHDQGRIGTFIWTSCNGASGYSLSGVHQRSLCSTVEDMFTFVGFFVNELINHGLKIYIKQPRPSTCTGLGYGACDSFGYPSSHSQCIWYLISCSHMVCLNMLDCCALFVLDRAALYEGCAVRELHFMGCKMT